MRWPPIILLLYILLGLEIGLAPYLTLRNSTPNFGLIAVIFISLNGPRRPVLATSLLLGLTQDMLSVHPLGLFAVAYVLAAYFVLAMRDIVYREHPLTHLTFTFIAGLLITALVLLQGWMHPLMPASGAIPAQRPAMGPLLLGSLYTAVLAVIILYPLQRWRRLFFRRSVE